MLYSIILACNLNGGGIGYNNYIPWSIKSELNLFRSITTGYSPFKKNAIIMGKKTWDSLPIKPLKNRLNIVITTDKKFINYDNVISFNNLDDAFNYCECNTDINDVFVIGGKSLYDLCLNNEKYSKNIKYIYLSIIYKYYFTNISIDLKHILTNYKCLFSNISFYKDYLHLKMEKNNNLSNLLCYRNCN